MNPEKKRDLFKRPSDAAVRLANDIYYTYLQEEGNCICISVNRLCEVFGDSEIMNVKIGVAQIFEELNEPIALKDYHYRGEKITWRMIQFFTYHFFTENDQEYIHVEIDELFLDALEKLESEPFINFQ